MQLDHLSGWETDLACRKKDPDVGNIPLPDVIAIFITTIIITINKDHSLLIHRGLKKDHRDGEAGHHRMIRTRRVSPAIPLCVEQRDK